MDSKIILKSVEAVTKKWTKQRKQEERGRAQSRRAALVRSYKWTIKDAADEVMESAYLKASDNGTLPAAARQIMYAARPEILRITGESELSSSYFSQTLLRDYINNNPEQTAEWDVVFDSRGHLAEPHTKVIIPLGTLDVRSYLQDVDGHSVESLNADDFIKNIFRFPTCGPCNRFGALLFIEKEGFLPIFQAVKLAERFDIAIMSTKGMTVVACRRLADEICGQYNIPLLVLHDFDKAGFSILGTLEGALHYDKNGNERTAIYEYKNNFEVIDLGLRLPDIRTYDLQSESVHYTSDPSDNLKENGAAENEVDFLYSPNSRYGRYSGKRVELNAFTSRDFITWIESKLKMHGIKKVIPAAETLETAYRRSLQIASVREQIEGIIEAAKQEVNEIPKNLTKAVQKALKNDPAKSWDEVVTDMAENENL
jgi:hypothetical protein